MPQRNVIPVGTTFLLARSWRSRRTSGEVGATFLHHMMQPRTRTTGWPTERLKGKVVRNEKFYGKFPKLSTVCIITIITIKLYGRLEPEGLKLEAEA
jgi:hypothetical protein